MSKKKQIPKTNTKTSFYINPLYVRALEAIWKKHRVLKSHQVELGLGAYFDSHKEFLKAEGIDLWSAR